MGKYILYAVIIFMLLFGANFFGFVRIPWLDVPFATDANYYKSGTLKHQEEADKTLNAK